MALCNSRTLSQPAVNGELARTERPCLLMASQAGFIPAESPVAHRIERLVFPLRDAFAAAFFFAFGLTIDPGDCRRP